jgi:hypothetical protein
LNDFNVLTEGAADKPLLEGAFGALQPANKSRLLINGSLSETEGFLPKFYRRAGVPVIAFVDADTGGRTIKAALLRWGFEEAQIVDLKSIFPGRGNSDFEIEDVVDAGFYHRAVQVAYPDNQVDAPGENYIGKRTKHYERVFRDVHGIGFNKKRVADSARTLLEQGQADEATKQSLTLVTDAIWAALQRQLPTAPIDNG